MSRAVRVALETLGCKLNQAETESLARQFLRRGCQLAESPREADVYVLNTCTVTHIADRKARHLLRSARRSNLQALIIAVGCYAQRAPAELAQLGAVDLILSAAEKDRLIDMVENRLGRVRNRRTEISPVGGLSSVRTRALIKIQDGCDDFCSFCIVPYTRGREGSLPLDKVLEEVRARVDAGYREVTLTGTKIGAYLGNGLCVTSKEWTPGLPRLIERILKETAVERLRLSSLQPQDLTPESVKLWADKRLCPHLHLSLQSGSDGVLQRMKRRYSTYDYERAVSLAREAISDLAITTDILAGFPGESEREFEESYHFCQKIGFANIHVFPYSPRPGTAAARMPHQVEDRVRKERTQRMLTLAQESAHRFREQFRGRTVPVLWERKVERGVWSGLTDNYLRVFAESEEPLTNRLLPVRLVGHYRQGLLGETVDGRENG